MYESLFVLLGIFIAFAVYKLIKSIITAIGIVFVIVIAFNLLRALA